MLTHILLGYTLGVALNWFVVSFLPEEEARKAGVSKDSFYLSSFYLPYFFFLTAVIGLIQGLILEIWDFFERLYYSWRFRRIWNNLQDDLQEFFKDPPEDFEIDPLENLIENVNEELEGELYIEEGENGQRN